MKDDAQVVDLHSRFNEAAGFTQRKPATRTQGMNWIRQCFNEAAGFTQRKTSIMRVNYVEDVMLQ